MVMLDGPKMQMLRKAMNKHKPNWLWQQIQRNAISAIWKQEESMIHLPELYIAALSFWALQWKN